MNLEVVRVGYLRTNCYILKKEGQVLVIDPGDEYSKIKEKIGEDAVAGVIITHHHPDHVGALEYFDAEKIKDYFNMKEGMHQVGPFSFEVIYTPGHKSDSISIYFASEKWMFTGDFLFRMSIGRTDFPTGNMDEMIESLKKVSSYPKDITIYPGHGPSSLLGEELANNQYLLQ